VSALQQSTSAWEPRRLHLPRSLHSDNHERFPKVRALKFAETPFDVLSNQAHLTGINVKVAAI
jgi:hypothetical protein